MLYLMGRKKIKVQQPLENQLQCSWLPLSLVFLRLSMLWVLCLSSSSTSQVDTATEPGNPADSLFKGGILSSIEDEVRG